MRRIGQIYNRDNSKSHTKSQQNNINLNNNKYNLSKQQYSQANKVAHPIKSTSRHVISQKTYQRQRQGRVVQKGWKFQLDNITESSNNSIQTNQGYFQTDCRQMSDHDSGGQAQKDKLWTGCKYDSEVAAKMQCIEIVMKEMMKLRNCQLNPGQNDMLNKIQDRLLNIEKKILEQQKENILK